MRKAQSVTRSVTDVRKSPLKVQPSNKGGVLQLRHPWFDNKVIRVGVKRLSSTEQGELYLEASRLAERAPRYRHEAPAGVRESLLEKYFEPLDAHDHPHYELEIDETGRVEGMKIGADPEAIAKLIEFKSALAKRERRIQELDSERQKLEAQVSVLVRASGERSEAERRTSIRECFNRFEERFQCRPGSKTEERTHVLRRVRLVLEQLGWDRKHGSIEQNDIKKAIDQTKPASDNERTKRTVDIKRFFKFLCIEKAQDGLGFINNPAARLAYLNPKTLQKMRRAKGLIKTASPEDVLEELDPYWKAFYGICCYAGLRLGEAAALTWDRIDFERRIIKVLPSEVYDRLKSDLSERPVKPFKELWPILEAHRATGLNETIVFPKAKNPKESWFYTRDGHAKVNHASRELSKALVAAGLTRELAREPQRRARRYWETRIRSIGRADLIRIMGGHTESVGLDHYTDLEQVVLNVKGDNF